MNAYRIIDANINRASEGIRVIEDICRFILEDKPLTEALRVVRHDIRKTYKVDELVKYRESLNDIGLNISNSTEIDKKENINDLLISNFKRAEEAIRSIEESLKIIGNYSESKIYESIRFRVYDLEKKVSFKRNIFNNDIYCITCEELSNGRSNIEVVKEMIDSGIKVIQYREKKKSKKEKYIECLSIRKMTEAYGVTFIVNDDLDIALLVGADGIHLGQDDIPVEEVRKISGNMIIGLSTHNTCQAKKALELKPDYIGVGPIFKTSTKENPEHCEGLSYLKWVSENIDIPHVAIGGINESNILDVKNNGGKCFALISDVVGSDSIKNKVNDIRKKIK